MSLAKTVAAFTGSLILVGSFSASALETIFEQDFESGLGANESIVIDPGEGTIDTRWVTCSLADCPFSVSRSGDSVRNFDIHHKSTNPYAGGNGGAPDPMKYNPNMTNQVLGHVRADYDAWEDNYYQVDNISLDAGLSDITLKFDFDSWIEKDSPDGFAVAINDGSGWMLLDPNGDSDMVYRDIGTVGDNSLNALTGQDTSTGATIRGFDGWDENGNAIDMAGLAMFDIADSYAGGTISLRFAFASDGDSSQAEGINIDNIMVTGCLSGDPTCDDPPGDVPAPASLALAAFGVMALRRRRSKR